MTIFNDCDQQWCQGKYWYKFLIPITSCFLNIKFYCSFKSFRNIYLTCWILDSVKFIIWKPSKLNKQLVLTNFAFHHRFVRLRFKIKLQRKKSLTLYFTSFMGHFCNMKFCCVHIPRFFRRPRKLLQSFSDFSNEYNFYDTKPFIKRPFLIDQPNTLEVFLLFYRRF